MGRKWACPGAVSVFVTGTDTGVGKTYVARLLIEALRGVGIAAVGYKPVACGDRADATVLAAASGNLARDLVNPLFLKPALAPMVAAMLENRDIEPASLVAGYHALAGEHPCVVAEGAGGWEVPITADYRMSDLAAALGLPVVVVAANKLGCLNHTLLTVNAIRQRGLTCAGIVLNQLEDEMDTAMITNKGVLESLTGVPILAHLIHQQDHLDPEPFLEWCGQPAGPSAC